MRQNSFLKLIAAVAIIVGVFFVFVKPLAFSIRQGLDLQGGTHVVLPHDIKQARAHQAGDVGGGINRQRRHGHDVGRRFIQADGGQELQVHAEGVQKHDA